MSDKLKFKNEEISDKIMNSEKTTEKQLDSKLVIELTPDPLLENKIAVGEPAEKPLSGKIVIEPASNPSPSHDNKHVVEETAVKFDGGGKPPDTRILNSAIELKIADIESAEITLTLHEYKSSLQFDKKDKTVESQKEKSENKRNKRKKKYDIFDLHAKTSDKFIPEIQSVESKPKTDNLIDKPTTEIEDSESTQKTDNSTNKSTSKSENNESANSNKNPEKKEKQSEHRNKKINKLQQKTDKYNEKKEEARNKMPTRKKKIKARYFDEEKGKARTKLRFEKEIIPKDEAKWNVQKKQSLPIKGVSALTSMGVNKLHSNIYKVENENVGTKLAHNTELVGERALRSGKRLIHETHSHIKNAPYRKAMKFETKEIKTRMKLDYQKFLKENPKMKSNPVSRFMQKHKIKKQYADALRKAKKSGETLKKTGSIVTKATQMVTNIVRKNPIFLFKVGLLLLIILVIISLLTMCLSIFSGGGSGVFGSAAYLADDDDINQAELTYTEWETDLRIKILNAETTHSGYDEYRYNIGDIGHNPLELMAFLTTVYQDFKYANIVSAMQNIFEQQYILKFISEIEIRQRWEQVGWEQIIIGYNPVFIGYDLVTGTPIYDYIPIYEYIPVYDWVDYEWHILNVNLTSMPFMDILNERMNDEQKNHFNVLKLTNGARQYGTSPFETASWLPNLTNYYGYRIHPITGVKDLHRGVDIVMPESTEILAGINGVVTVAAYDSKYGNYIVIKSADGIEMKYAHCQTLLYSVGQTIAKGEVIATVGNTGDSTGAHLHIEIMKDNEYLNPIYFIEIYN